jgi:putative heme transporter
MVLILAVVGLVVFVAIAGITSQRSEIAGEAGNALAKVKSWLESAGVDTQGASGAASGVQSATPEAISTLVSGLIHGIQGLTSVVFELSLGALSTFFLLKDGPSMREWADRHLGVPAPVARTITTNVIKSLRGYFRGVTIVALFNGAVVGIGALVLGVPLAGTIAVVTYVAAYIPFIGAFIAGAFAVVIALGADGTTTALIMLVVVILANGLLQNVVQPFAMGSALDLHPLAVLVITIAAGCVFGMIGLVLAGPLTSAAVHILRELGTARASARRTPTVDPPPGREPAPQASA